MRQNRHIAGEHQFEKEVLQLRRRRMMRRFDQHVARIGERQQAARTQARDEIGGRGRPRPSPRSKEMSSSSRMPCRRWVASRSAGPELWYRPGRMCEVQATTVTPWSTKAFAMSSDIERSLARRRHPAGYGNGDQSQLNHNQRLQDAPSSRQQYDGKSTVNMNE